MRGIQRVLSRISLSSSPRITANRLQSVWISQKPSFSSESGGGGDGGGGGKSNENAWGQGWDSVGSSNTPQQPSAPPFGGFDSVSSWSTGLTENDFQGEAVGLQVAQTPEPSMEDNTAKYQAMLATHDALDEDLAELEKENRKSKVYIDSWKERMKEVNLLLKQVNEPGVRGSYLKDSEKDEMYRLHKEDPQVYTIEKLAKDYRVMRQRVHAILWLKELQEEEEKKLGQPLDDSVEQLLDSFPEFFNSHDREFHVATLPYKPDFKVMPEGWDGTIRDPDEVHYDISTKEDEILYQEFVQRMNFNKKKMAGEVKAHKYSRRRGSDGWNITVEKLGPRGKRGGGGGWKFVSLPDGSTRPLNEMEKIYVKRETVKRRRKILP